MQLGLFFMQEVFLSMWTSLILQLKAKYYVLNCQSAWHQVIHWLRKAGCGNSVPVVFCLTKQRPDSPFFLCAVSYNPWHGRNYGVEQCKRKSQAPNVSSTWFLRSNPRGDTNKEAESCWNFVWYVKHNSWELTFCSEFHVERVQAPHICGPSQTDDKYWIGLSE